MNLFDLTLSLNKFPIKKARFTLKEIQQKSEAEFESYVKEQRRIITSFHLKHNSFYKAFAKDANISDWSSIPVITKRHLQQPLLERLSDGYPKKEVYINKTSGSSGNPFTFAKDRFCHAMTWAIIQNRFSWFDLDFNSSKQARFYGIPLDKKNYLKERLKDKLSNRFRFSVFDLSDAAFATVLSKFKSNTFNYINGYTSSIVQFSKFLDKKSIVLKDVCPNLKACVVTSEMLFENDKKLMKRVFGVPIINEYGASELDLIAFENPEGFWQLNSETLFVEILDDDDTILPHGETGRVVITSLYNKAHPFIRYDIGDIGIISKESTFKRPILEKLIGRTNDIAILPSGKKAAGLTFYYITKSIIEDDGNVKEFVIEQVRVDHFNIKYVSEEVLSLEKVEIIKAEIERYLEPNLTITFKQMKQLERTPSGKLKQFTSNIN